MFKRKQLRQAIAAAFLAMAGAGHLAFAANEAEPAGTRGANDSIQTAERLFLTSGDCAGMPVVPMQTCVVLNGVLGTSALPLSANPPLPDLDFYAFEAYKGNVLNVDIDGGMSRDSNKRSVNTTIAIFGPLPSVAKVRENINMDKFAPPDPGSEDFRDALIENFTVPGDGVYVVGVSSEPRFFQHGGGVDSPTVLGSQANGAYTLKISGVIPPELQVNIEVKPGNAEDAPVNPKSKGNFPVAILSSATFDALKVDRYSLTFGKKGDEKTYVGCLKHGMDVNADGFLDLVCHFDNQAAGWDVDDVEGVMKGKTVDGTKFSGRGRLKIVPKQRD